MLEHCGDADTDGDDDDDDDDDCDDECQDDDGAMTMMRTSFAL